jgi:predicted alpha/beta hydrolase family esterase
MKKALLLHGFMSDENSFFLPNTKTELEALKYEVYLKSYPNPQNPNIEEWVNSFLEFNLKEFDLVIAHSLGGTFALNLITRELLKAKILIMLGSSVGPKNNAGMNTFLTPPLELEKVKASVPKIIIAQSFDDPWTLPAYGKVAVQSLNAIGLFYANKGHFETKSLPEEIWKLII